MPHAILCSDLHRAVSVPAAVLGQLLLLPLQADRQLMAWSTLEGFSMAAAALASGPMPIA